MILKLIKRFRAIFGTLRKKSSSALRFSIDEWSETESYVFISGWLFEDGHSSENSCIVLCLQPIHGGEALQFPTSPVPRPDVSKHFKSGNYDNAGFRIHLNKAKLLRTLDGKGDFRAILVLRCAGRSIQIDIGRTLSVDGPALRRFQDQEINTHFDRLGSLSRDAVFLEVEASGFAVAERLLRANRLVLTYDRNNVRLLDPPGSNYATPSKLSGMPGSRFNGITYALVNEESWLRELQEKDVRELFEVTSRYIYLYISGLEWTRAEVEQRFISCGFFKTAKMFDWLGYEQPYLRTHGLVFLFEKPDFEAGSRFSLESLATERDEHMDMFREAGIRSDAHLLRYHWATSFIESGDAVLDCACGYGYGSSIIKSAGLAGRVLGIDVNPKTVDYAQTIYGKEFVKFQVGDAASLINIPRGSYDVAVSFETLEHIPDPRRYLQALVGILKPSGRFLSSVPNEWQNEKGQDPSPYHLHTFSWRTYISLLEEFFVVDRLWYQDALEGFPLLVEIPKTETDSNRAEWCLALCRPKTS